MSINVNDRVHWVVIKVHVKLNQDPIIFKRWADLPFKTRVKFGWYFKYRAALYQVQNPKCIVDLSWGSDIKTGERLKEVYANRLKGKKATITKTENILKEARANWTSLFPIENDPQYIRAMEKLERLKLELDQMTFENTVSDHPLAQTNEGKKVLQEIR